MRRFFAPALALTLTVGLTPPARAGADDPLPKGDAVLEQYVEATGGKAAYEKLKNRVSTGTLEVTGAGIGGKITVTQASPDKTLTAIELAQVGKTMQGTDGKVAWVVSDLAGERVLEGEEKETTLRQARFNREIYWKERYDKVECTGVEDVDGKPAYKVVLTPKAGAPVTEYFDKASHLMVKQSTVSKSPMGEINVETFPSNYKKVDGILIPFTAKQKLLTQEVVIAMTEVKHNVDLPADTFALPEGIKELLKKKDK